ncbi:MAG: hypothetical protein Q3998_01220, partial [Porphyromonas sp.]|nr:hypothetical protein [Porphyromonas sp.]
MSANRPMQVSAAERLRIKRNFYKNEIRSAEMRLQNNMGYLSQNIGWMVFDEVRGVVAERVPGARKLLGFLGLFDRSRSNTTIRSIEPNDPQEEEQGEPSALSSLLSGVVSGPVLSTVLPLAAGYIQGRAFNLGLRAVRKILSL